MFARPGCNHDSLVDTEKVTQGRALVGFDDGGVGVEFHVFQRQECAECAEPHGKLVDSYVKRVKFEDEKLDTKEVRHIL